MKKYFLFIVLAANVLYAQWQADMRLTNDGGASSTTHNNAKCISSSGDTLHIVWFDSRDGNLEIYYKRSVDKGQSWGTDTRLTNNSAESKWPSISANGLVVIIAWQDTRDGNTEIYCKRSSDAGLSWGADTRLTASSGNSDAPYIEQMNSDVHVVWQDTRDGNLEIYYKRSSDAGLTWSADTRLTSNNAESRSTSLSASQSNINLVWYDARDGNWELYLKRSTNGGITWSGDVRLTNNSAASDDPSIFASGATLHIVWKDMRDGNWEIYYKRSPDNGLSWGSDIRLTDNSAASWYSSVISSGLSVHLVWRDMRDGNNEIYYKSSTDGGLTWGTDTRLTNNSGESSYPSVCLSGQIVHLVWYDNRDGNEEIYYKRNPTGNPIGIVNISTEIPEQFSLSQNYPNPFNPETKIKFAVQKSGFVNISVYDILGRNIESLVNENLNPGTYEVNWNASNYPSGVYYYKINVSDFSETRKMILLK